MTIQTPFPSLTFAEAVRLHPQQDTILTHNTPYSISGITARFDYHAQGEKNINASIIHLAMRRVLESALGCIEDQSKFFAGHRCIIKFSRRNDTGSVCGVSLNYTDPDFGMKCNYPVRSHHHKAFDLVRAADFDSYQDFLDAGLNKAYALQLSENIKSRTGIDFDPSNIEVCIKRHIGIATIQKVKISSGDACMNDKAVEAFLSVLINEMASEKIVATRAAMENAALHMTPAPTI